MIPVQGIVCIVFVLCLLVQPTPDSVVAQELLINENASDEWQSLGHYFKPPASYADDYGHYSSVLQFNDGRTVMSASDWSKRRDEIKEYWMRKLGPWPATIDKPQVEVLSESNRENFQQKRIRLEIGPDQFSEGWLLVPKVQEKSMPAVLVVFYEPETSIGLKTDSPHRDFGLQLARKGFVTLNIGTPGGNAWKPETKDAQCQPLSYHAYVAANCFNALSCMPEVDPKRIGIVGHSYGGKWSMFAGALWDKFAAVAVSDPGIVFDETRPNVNYWEPWYLGRDSNPPRNPGVPTEQNPRTGSYAELVKEGHDLHELHALIAPRPFFVSGGSEDPVERWQALNRSLEVNRLLGYRDRIGMTNRLDHSPNGESNQFLIDFFVHFLMKEHSPTRN